MNKKGLFSRIEKMNDINHEKTDKLFDFLKSNREHNFDVQRSSYNQFITPHKTTNQLCCTILLIRKASPK